MQKGTSFFPPPFFFPFRTPAFSFFSSRSSNPPFISFTFFRFLLLPLFFLALVCSLFFLLFPTFFFLIFLPCFLFNSSFLSIFFWLFVFLSFLVQPSLLSFFKFISLLLSFSFPLFYLSSFISFLFLSAHPFHPFSFLPSRCTYASHVFCDL